MSFEGFRRPTTTDTPDEFFDIIMPQVKSLAELKVILYVVRHTFGYNKWLDRISLDEFENGITTQDKGGHPKRVDYGAGLTRTSITDGLKRAVEHDYLRKIIVCPSCNAEVQRVETQRPFKNRFRSGITTVMAAPDRCPFCRNILNGKEHVYYGLHWKDGEEPAPSPRDVLAKYRGLWRPDIAAAAPAPPSIESILGTSRESILPPVEQVYSQQLIPSASTLANASEALRASASAQADLSLSATDAAQRARQPSPGSSDNGLGDSLAKTAADRVSGVSQPPGPLDRLNSALADKSTAQAFTALVEAIEQAGGLIAATFRAARCSLSTIATRRRRALEDMRRMQARTDLKASTRRNNITAILTQNIGVTIGLGLAPDGQVRVVANKADYSVIGGLVNEYGTETVWKTACDIAGAAIEGDPLDYLRASLRNQSGRGRGAPTGSGGFDVFDYAGGQTLIQENEL